MQKKLTTLFILVFMISSLLFGCGEKPKNEQENDQPSINEENNQASINNKNEQENLGDEDEETDLDNENDEEESKPDSLPDQESDPKDSTDPQPKPNPEPDSEQKPEPELTVGTSIGNLMASLSLNRVDGGTVNIEDFRGKIIIFNIWATWCSPCMAELPDFDRIAENYSDDVVVIAVHHPRGSENAPSYIESNFKDSKINFAYDTQYYSAFYAAGGISSIPRTAILDQRGVIVYAKDGMMYYNQLVSIIESINDK